MRIDVTICTRIYHFFLLHTNNSWFCCLYFCCFWYVYRFCLQQQQQNFYWRICMCWVFADALNDFVTQSFKHQNQSSLYYFCCIISLTVYGVDTTVNEQILKNSICAIQNDETQLKLFRKQIQRGTHSEIRPIRLANTLQLKRWMESWAECESTHKTLLPLLYSMRSCLWRVLFVRGIVLCGLEISYMKHRSFSYCVLCCVVVCCAHQHISIHRRSNIWFEAANTLYDVVESIRIKY